MAKMAKLFTIRKFDGNSQGSWAVFRSFQVKGIRGVVEYGRAQPIYCGMTKREAEHRCFYMEAEAREKA